MSKQKVYISGYGSLTSTGHDADSSWQAIQDGQSGIGEITQHELGNWAYRLGGELKDFQPAKMLPDRKLIKVISRQDVMGINAAVQAVTHSGLDQYASTLGDATHFHERTGVYVGSPGNKYAQQYDFLPLTAKAGMDMQAFASQLFDEVHPMWLLRILPNNVLAYVGITYGYKGANHNVTNHAVGGAQALIEAWHAIQSGQIDRAVVVAYDMGLEAQALYYYGKMGVLSDTHLCPFDQRHNGTILAEGAAALVLESEASVKARGATCHAELAGGFSVSEAAGLFGLEPEGTALSRLLARSLAQLELSPADIGLVVAHGNGNPLSDDSESQAIAAVFGQQAVPVTAFKWSMGHTLCASGLVDSVMAIKAIQAGLIPAIPKLKQKAEASQNLNVTADHRAWDQGDYALIINRGFASMDACLVLKRCD